MELTDKRILFEDSELLAVDKPSGLVAHATPDPARDHLVAAVTRWLEARDGDAGHLRQHHRLDRGTSGVVLFSRRPEVDAVLSDAFAQRRILKSYWAIVSRPRRDVPTQWTSLRSYLAAGRGPGGRTVAVRSGGQPAHTQVRSIDVAGELVLVEARPHTGRTHQIRVHLADYGAPILGDELYGGGSPDVKRLLLHARRLELEHPATEQPLTIEAPAPRAFVRRFASLER